MRQLPSSQGELEDQVVVQLGEIYVAVAIEQDARNPEVDHPGADRQDQVPAVETWCKRWRRCCCRPTTGDHAEGQESARQRQATFLRHRSAVARQAAPASKVITTYTLARAEFPSGISGLHQTGKSGIRLRWLASSVGRRNASTIDKKETGR